MYAADEERLRLPDVTDAGDESLIEQRVSDFFVGVLTDALCRFREVEILGEEIGTECEDRL